MLRGTRVGQAYVSLAIDGDHINEDIEKQFEDVDYDKIGRDANNRFEEGWSNNQREASKKGIRERMQGVEKEMDDSLKRIGQAFDNDENITKGVRHQLAAAFSQGDLDPLIKRVGDHIGHEFGSSLDTSLKASVLNSLEDLMQRAAHEQRGFNLVSERGGINLPTSDLSRVIADAKKATDAELSMREKAATEYTKFWERELDLRERTEATADRALWAVRNTTAKAFAKYQSDLNRGVIDEFGRAITKASKKAESSIGDIVGKAFGKGSRNNFLNVLGSAAGGATTGIEKTVKGIGGLFKDLFSNVESGAGEAEQSLTGFQKILGGIQSAGSSAGSAATKALASIAESGPPAIAVMVALGLAATVVVSLLNGILAAASALVAVLASGLVAAASVAAAGLGALGVAAGLTILAFKSMDDAQKKALSHSFKPVKDELVGLGQTVLKDLVPAFDAWSKNIQRALGYLQPVAATLGGALAQGITTFTAALSGHGIQEFLAVLSGALPGIINTLSHAMGQLLNGLGSTFSLLLPYVQAFADYLDRAATSFRKWSGSLTGQSEISNFFARAVTSLHQVWDLLGSVGHLFTTIFFSSSGQQVGGSIIEKITRSINKLSDWLAKDHHLEHWFKQGQDAADTLGSLISIISNILKGLNSSGVTAGLKWVTGAFAKLGPYIQGAVDPLKTLVDLLGKVHIPSALSKLADKAGGATNGALHSLTHALSGGLVPRLSTGAVSGNTSLPATGNDKMSVMSSLLGLNLGTPRGSADPGNDATVQALIDLGQQAEAATSKAINKVVKSGNKNAKKNADKLSKAAHQQMVDYANALEVNPNSVSAQIKNAANNNAKILADAQASQDKSIDSVINGLTAKFIDNPAISALQNIGETLGLSISGTVETITTNADNLVNTAQDAVNSAADRLKNATTKTAAKAAKKALDAATKDLAAARAQQRAANKEGAGLNAGLSRANTILTQQQVLTQANIDLLVSGVKAATATLADYAAARTAVAQKLQDATQAYQAALSQMDSYRSQVTDSIKQFGVLTTAQATAINGVTQALSAGDITANLQDRLQKIRDFQNNINTLIAEGASNDVIKQITDAGVDSGSQFAQALANGGAGAIQTVNQLTDQIAASGDALGAQTSSRFYQAGVDAAQGLLDGLNSISAQLDQWATDFGNTIEQSLRDALQMHSPSRRMFNLMGYVGDGAALGLDAQHGKLDAASARFASHVGVSPEVARYAASRGDAAPVSGNGQIFRDLIVQTPTTDPKAVAREAINELTGRL